MLQTLIVAIVVVLAAVWVLKNAYDKIKPSAGGTTTCGGGCSGCSPTTAAKTGCGCVDQERKKFL